MGRIRDADGLTHSLEARLAPGESLRGWGHALEMPPAGRLVLLTMAFVAPLVVLVEVLHVGSDGSRGMIIGALSSTTALVAMTFLMRDRAVALTDRRVLAVEVVAGRTLGETVLDVAIPSLPAAKAKERSTGLRLTIPFGDRKRLWVFPARPIPGNLDRAREIAAAFPRAA